VKLDLHCVQGNSIARLGEGEIDGLVTVEGVGREVDVDGKRIVTGRRAARQALRNRCAADRSQP